jgi:hypothetical protein
MRVRARKALDVCESSMPPAVASSISLGFLGCAS